MADPAPAWADVHETHIGAVFLVGDLAYKLKKPVDLGLPRLHHPREPRTRLPPRGRAQPAAGARRLPGRLRRHRARRRGLRPPRRDAPDARGPPPLDAGPAGTRRCTTPSGSSPGSSPPSTRPAERGPAIERRWDPRRGPRPVARQLRAGPPLPRHRARPGDRGRDRSTRPRTSSPAARRCSTGGSPAGTSSTGTATCSPTTSSASTTAPACWTAWSSTTTSATSTSSTTSPSSRWTSNGSAPRNWPNSSSPTTASSPAIPLPRRCCTTTSPTARSSGPRSPACAHAQGDADGRRASPASTPTSRCGTCGWGRSG